MQILNRITPKIFFSENTLKTHVILHHTAGGDVEGAINTWIKNSSSNVGTHYIIGRNGEIVQLIPQHNWAYSLGLKSSTWKYKMDWEKGGVTIELVSWGGLKWNGANWVTWANTIISDQEVDKINYRGYEAYHSYSDAQIKSLLWLMYHIASTTGIKLMTGDLDTFFDDKISELSAKKPSEIGNKTIYTHVNFRKKTEKQDCYPSPKLKQMLSLFSEKKKTIDNSPKQTSQKILD